MPGTPAEHENTTHAPSGSKENAQRENDRELRRAMRFAVAAGLLVDVVLITIAALQGTPQLWGALIGTGLALVVTLPGLLIAERALRLAPIMLAALVLGSWLLKMVVVIIVIALVRDTGAVAMPWLGVALLAGAIAAIIAETVVVARRRPLLEVEGL